MNQFGLTFHHFGLAVSKPEKAIHFLNSMGYEIGEKVFDALQNVNLKMCTGNEMPDVELIFPSETKGPLDKMLADRNEIIYHICYRTSNVNEALEKMKAGGNRLICVSKPKQAILFNNHPVSFYQVAGFGLIEFLEM
ncbi:MAG: VOC family protein [Bacteroidia bacterium]